MLPVVLVEVLSVLVVALSGILGMLLVALVDILSVLVVALRGIVFMVDISLTTYGFLFAQMFSPDIGKLIVVYFMAPESEAGDGETAGDN